MATTRANLYREFMATPEEERLAFCGKIFSLHLDEVSRTDNLEAAKKRLETLRLMICEDAKMPEVWEAFLAKLNEVAGPYINKTAKQRKIMRGSYQRPSQRRNA